MTVADSSRRGGATREIIFQAALAEFGSFGYRRSSMDSVSRRAGISRATLYLHWNGKQQLFRALVEQLHEQHLASMRAVLDDPPPALDARLTAILRARFERFVELTSASSNAAELYDVHDRICGDIARTADDRAVSLVVQFLHEARDEHLIDLSASGLTIDQAATALLDCAHVAKGDDPSGATPADFNDRIARLISLTINGLAPRG